MSKDKISYAAYDCGLCRAKIILKAHNVDEKELVKITEESQEAHRKMHEKASKYTIMVKDLRDIIFRATEEW